ncbi:MAG: hypothetical protein RL077_396 [Verrucomicrobiota bacterium]|jgi:DNA-binding LacI/PurR family transcriptional regulator
MKNYPAVALTPPKRVSLVAQTVHSLRAALAAGYWRETMPGERELCQTLEVSRPTLRAALAELEREGGLKSVARTRRRIVAKATPLHPASRIVAVISPAPLRQLAPNMVLVIDALRDHLGRSGWTMQMHVSRSCFTRHPDRALQKLTARAPAAIWLLITSVRPMQEWFLRHSLRCLVAGTCSEGIGLPSVDAAHHATGRHAGALLLRKGHRRITLVRSDENTGGDNESVRGFREAIASAPTTTLEIMSYRSRDHLIRLLDLALRSNAPCTAYFVLRSVDVLTVITHLLRRNRRIPQDAAVISRDGDEFLDHVSPLVTRYVTDTDRFAQQISRLVRTAAETGTLNPRAIRLMPKFIAGKTA